MKFFQLGNFRYRQKWDREIVYNNDLEIRVIGQMRSGNHAIIQWIQSLYLDKSVVFLNNLLHGDCDPFESYHEIEVSGINLTALQDIVNRIRKDVLIYSYEDRISLQHENLNFLTSVFNADFEANKELYIGTSKSRYDVIIIRDPFNFLASRLAMVRKDPQGGVDDMNLIKETWKDVAQHVLAINAKNNENPLIVNYNRWILSASYQRSLARRLGGLYQQPSFTTISTYGGGSSFEQPLVSRLTFRDLIAKKSKIFDWRQWREVKRQLERLLMNERKPFLTRWQLLSADEQYRSLFRDRELLHLSERLFGVIPGTRAFVDSIAGPG